ncbi:MAG TPA: DUF4286 family protein [Sphingobacteriaceae bacterium]
MILYNVTIIIDEGIEKEWLNWMRTIHIPEVMATGKFVSNRLLRVLESPNEGITFCSQYIADSLESYNEYRNEFSPALQAAYPAEFENRFVTFRTIMEYVD